MALLEHRFHAGGDPGENIQGGFAQRGGAGANARSAGSGAGAAPDVEQAGRVK